MDPCLCLFMQPQSMQQKQTQPPHSRAGYLFSSETSRMHTGLRSVWHGLKSTLNFSSATVAFFPCAFLHMELITAKTTVNARLVQL